jgi:hypothetical protein
MRMTVAISVIQNSIKLSEVETFLSQDFQTVDRSVGCLEMVAQVPHARLLWIYGI